MASSSSTPTGPTAAKSTSSYEAEEFRGESLLEGGLRTGYLWEYGKYEIAAFGRNITDEEVIVGGIDFNNLTGFLNEPRIWGVEFKASF